MFTVKNKDATIYTTVQAKTISIWIGFTISTIASLIIAIVFIIGMWKYTSGTAFPSRYIVAYAGINSIIDKGAKYV